MPIATARRPNVALSVESLEERVTPTAPLIYDADADGSLVARVVSGSVQVIDQGTESILSSRPSLVCRAIASDGKLVSAMIRSSPWPIARSA